MGPRRLNVVLEHFNFEMQPLLDAFSDKKLTLDELNKAYAENGTEGHDIMAYSSLLQHAQTHAEVVKLHAGFIPRTYARMIMREGVEKGLTEAKAAGFIDAAELCQGSPEHYNFFESMISGRDMHDPALEPGTQFAKMFPAQVIKDCSMAHKVRQLLEEDPDSEDRYLIITGTGHMGYGFGVPERILHEKDLNDQIYMVFAKETDHKISLDKEEPADYSPVLQSLFGKSQSVADTCYVFEEWEYDEEVQPKMEMEAEAKA